MAYKSIFAKLQAQNQKKQMNQSANSFQPMPAPMAQRVQPPVAQAPVAPAYVEPDFKPDTAPIKAGGQFDLMKKQAESRLAGAETQGRDALNRRFAQLGNLNSGAALKIENQLQDQVARQREEALGGVDIAAAQDVSAREQQREASNLAREQSSLQRRLQSSQFGQSLGEQQRQARFAEGIAGREADLSEFNTMYNTALSAATSGSQAAVNKTFEKMFNRSPNFQGGYTNAMAQRVGDVAAPITNENRQLSAREQFKINRNSFDPFKNASWMPDKIAFQRKARAAGYSDADIKKAIKYGGG